MRLLLFEELLPRRGKSSRRSQLHYARIFEDLSLLKPGVPQIIGMAPRCCARNPSSAGASVVDGPLATLLADVFAWIKP